MYSYVNSSKPKDLAPGFQTKSTNATGPLRMHQAARMGQQRVSPSGGQIMYHRQQQQKVPTVMKFQQTKPNIVQPKSGFISKVRATRSGSSSLQSAEQPNQHIQQNQVPHLEQIHIRKTMLAGEYSAYESVAPSKFKYENTRDFDLAKAQQRMNANRQQHNLQQDGAAEFSKVNNEMPQFVNSFPGHQVQSKEKTWYQEPSSSHQKAQVQQPKLYSYAGHQQKRAMATKEVESVFSLAPEIQSQEIVAELQKLMDERFEPKIQGLSQGVQKIVSCSAQVLQPQMNSDIFADKKAGQRKHPTFGGQVTVDTNLREQHDADDLTNDISPMPSLAGITKFSSDVYAASGSDQSKRYEALSFGKSSNQPSQLQVGQENNLNFTGFASQTAQSNFGQNLDLQIQKNAIHSPTANSILKDISDANNVELVLSDTQNVKQQYLKGMKVQSGNAVFNSQKSQFALQKSDKKKIQKSGSGDRSNRLSRATIINYSGLAKKKRMTFKSSSSQKTDVLEKRARSKLSGKIISSFVSNVAVDRLFGQAPKKIQKKVKIGVRKSETSQESMKIGINSIKCQHTKSASFVLAEKPRALVKLQDNKQRRVAPKVKLSQHKQASTYLDDEPMGEEPEKRHLIQNFSKTNEKISGEPQNILDLLCLDRQQDDEEFSQPFSLSDQYPIQQSTFHPSSGKNDFEEDQEEEMIQVVNPNKHIQNGEDGGRRRKLRHVSKIESFARGKDAIRNFCKDLFSVKQPQDLSCQEDLSIGTSHNFSQILEEKNEESPPGKTDQSMKSNSRTSMTEFRIQARTCSPEQEEKSKEMLTQEQSEPVLIDSFGIADELFVEDGKASLLQTLEFQESFAGNCNPIEGQTLAKLLTTKSHPVIIVDCRFDYEYNYGHIKGAINIDNQRLIEKTFLHDVQKVREIMQTNTILVFHCEFSQKRGPSLWKTLRELDRNINHKKWPKVFFSEMYLLEKGFSAFYGQYPELCNGGYKCQDGDKLEKTRYRSMKRDLKSYSVQESALQLRKSASTHAATRTTPNYTTTTSDLQQAQVPAREKRPTRIAKGFNMPAAI